MPELVSPENLLVKLKTARSSEMHEVVKSAETTVASIGVGDVKLEGRPPGKFFKDQFWERFYLVLLSAALAHKAGTC